MPAITKDILVEWGRESASALINDGVPLNSSIIKIAEQNSLNVDQVSRLVEMANISMHTSVYQNNKYPEFEVADIQKIASTLNQVMPKIASIDHYDVSPNEFDFDFVEKTATYRENFPAPKEIPAAIQLKITEGVLAASRFYDEKVAELVTDLSEIVRDITKDVKQSVLNPDEREGTLVFFKSAALGLAPKGLEPAAEHLVNDIENSLKLQCRDTLIKEASYIDSNFEFESINLGHPMAQKLASYFDKVRTIKNAVDNKQDSLDKIAANYLINYGYIDKEAMRSQSYTRPNSDNAAQSKSNFKQSRQYVSPRMTNQGAPSTAQLTGTTMNRADRRLQKNKPAPAPTPMRKVSPVNNIAPAATTVSQTATETIAQPARQVAAKTKSVSNIGTAITGAGNRIVSTMASDMNALEANAKGAVTRVGIRARMGVDKLHEASNSAILGVQNAVSNAGTKARSAAQGVISNIGSKARGATQSAKGAIQAASEKLIGGIKSNRLATETRGAIGPAGKPTSINTANQMAGETTRRSGPTNISNAEQAAGNAADKVIAKQRQGTKVNGNATGAPVSIANADQAAGNAADKVIAKQRQGTKVNGNATGAPVSIANADQAAGNAADKVIAKQRFGANVNGVAEVAASNAPDMKPIKVKGKVPWGLLGKITAGVAVTGTALGLGFKAGANAAGAANAPLRKENLPPRYQQG